MVIVLLMLLVTSSCPRGGLLLQIGTMINSTLSRWQRQDPISDKNIVHLLYVEINVVVMMLM